MFEGTNRQQAGNDRKGVCPACGGKKKVKSADGATLVKCYLCRGTGESGGKLSTK